MIICYFTPMKLKFVFPVGVLLLLAGFGMALLFQSNSETEVMKNRAELMRHYKVFPVPLPAEMELAGEKVPLNDPEVRERLDRELLINTYWQSNTLLMIKRTKRAFEVMEPILAANKVPDDFKYLAVIESSLTNAVSGSGAAGYWQFLKATGQSCGLEVNDDVDERYHLEKSTVAACKYLLHAKDVLGSWAMAAAAYNRGIQGVMNARNSQEQTDYYQLWLNSETSRYNFRIMAMKLIIENPHHYGFHVKPHDFYKTIETYKVKVDSTITSLPRWAKDLHSNYKMLKELNPWLMGYELKIEKGKTYELLVPTLQTQGSESEH